VPIVIILEVARGYELVESIAENNFVFYYVELLALEHLSLYPNSDSSDRVHNLYPASWSYVHRVEQFSLFGGNCESDCAKITPITRQCEGKARTSSHVPRQWHQLLIALHRTMTRSFRYLYICKFRCTHAQNLQTSALWLYKSTWVSKGNLELFENVTFYWRVQCPRTTIASPHDPPPNVILLRNDLWRWTTTMTTGNSNVPGNLIKVSANDFVLHGHHHNCPHFSERWSSI